MTGLALAMARRPAGTGGSPESPREAATPAPAHTACEKPPARPNRPSYAIRHDGCRECGTGFYGRPEAEFCCDKCRAAFNSRRAKRGAEVYDLLMTWHAERTIGSLTLLSRAAARFWREDRAERPGRKSWFPLASIIARRPYLKAQRLGQKRKPS